MGGSHGGGENGTEGAEAHKRKRSAVTGGELAVKRFAAFSAGLREARVELVGGVHIVAGERKRTRRVPDERIRRQRGEHGEPREQRERRELRPRQRHGVGAGTSNSGLLSSGPLGGRHEGEDVEGGGPLQRTGTGGEQRARLDGRCDGQSSEPVDRRGHGGDGGRLEEPEADGDVERGEGGSGNWERGGLGDRTGVG